MSLAATNVLYREPRLHDAVFDGDTTQADTVAALARRHGRPGPRSLLDIGCATGRDLARLAASERWVASIGVDVQPALVEHGLRVRPGLALQVGDVRTLRLDAAFDVVMCVGNTLSYLHDDAALEQAFTTFRAHADRGSLLVVRTMIGAPVTTPPRTGTMHLLGSDVRVTTGTEYEPRTRVAVTRRTWEFPDGRTEVDLLRRHVVPADVLRELLHAARFEPWAIASDPLAPDEGVTTPTAWAVAVAR